MKMLRAAGALTLSALVLAACGDDATSVEVAELAGAWNATRFEYTDNANPMLTVDAISDVGGSVTLDVQESGAFTGSISAPGITVDTAGQTISVPIGGTISVDGDTLTIDFNSLTEALGLFSDFSAPYELSGNVLTFVYDDADIDFPDTFEQQAGVTPRGEVSATLHARFVR